MSVPLTQLGGHAVSHHSGANASDEAEYDRLRGLAHSAAEKRSSCFQRSQEAYKSDNKGLAHELSEEGKSHGRDMERYNSEARDFIFRANNADLPADTIDLHGLYVEEAEEMLETRINAAQGRGEDGLHVIVGKGNHSQGGVRKIEPAVEKICNAKGLKWKAEENQGRMYVWLKDGGGEIPPPPKEIGGGYPGQGKEHGEGHAKPQHPPKHEQPQEEQKPEGLEGMAKKALPGLLKKIGNCCVIM